MHVPRLQRTFSGIFGRIFSALRGTLGCDKMLVAILKQLTLLDPCPQTALVQTAQDQKHLVIERNPALKIQYCPLCIARLRSLAAILKNWESSVGL